MFRFDRRLLQNVDWVLVGGVLLVTLMAMLNLYSSTRLNDAVGLSAFFKQFYFNLMGFGLILLIVMVDYKALLALSYPLYILGLLMLVAAMAFGETVAGSQRWIDLGFFRLQPSEPAKLIMIIVLASYYYRKDTGKGFTLTELFVPIVLTLIPFLLILKQPDLGTALIILIIFASMTLFVKLRWSTFGVLAGTALGALPVVWKMLKPYQRQRIETFLNPESDPLGSGYHITQSKIAVGSGLKFGKGYLHGTQGQLDFLPERHTDFAFSVWAEEWGFFGSLFFMACYFFVLLWGLNIAVTARDKFGMLLAFGIVALLFWQAFINMAMIMGLLPVVGVPLPLFSYGGSSLLTNLAGIGLLINIRMRRFMVAS
ncbi:MAG: rod shape-determining protein RodA [Thermodesulfobacteriota bacterium]